MFPGTGYMRVNDVLALMSYILIEPVVSTTLGTAVVAPGVATITPLDMTSIYPSTQLIAGAGATQEVVNVTATTATTFTAVFAFAHSAADVLYGATFPVAQTIDPFYTQAEVLGHLSDAQNDFLTRAPIVLNTVTQNFIYGQRIQALPADCIQIERVSLVTTPAAGVTGGKTLWEQGQSSMDLLDKYWAQTPYTTPDRWYEDRTGFENYGVAPIPGNAFAVSLLYAQRDSAQLALNEGFLLPDPFLHYVMYGALAQLFGKDGEQRDPARAKYCDQRFDLGINVANRLYSNVMAQTTMNGG